MPKISYKMEICVQNRLTHHRLRHVTQRKSLKPKLPEQGKGREENQIPENKQIHTKYLENGKRQVSALGKKNSRK